jgi:large subunit ribosomal protein L5
MQRLKSVYIKEVLPKLFERFKYKNINQVPRVLKIVINRGFDDSCQNAKTIDMMLNELTALSGQKGVICLAKKAIASFKVKEKMPVGIFITLRGERMYSFLDRLINLALPRIRDFQGLTNKNFDGCGNYSFGLRDQLMFPEIDFDKISKIQGMDICIVTTANNDEESYFLLKELGVPFNS